MQSLQNFLQLINLHIYAKNEHVGFIENKIKKITERSILVSHTAPYRQYTLLTKQSIAEGVIDMLKISHQKMQYQTP